MTQQNKPVQVYEGQGIDHEPQQFVEAIVKHKDSQNKDPHLKGFIPKEVFEQLVVNMRNYNPVSMDIKLYMKQPGDRAVYTVKGAVLHSWTANRGREKNAVITAESIE